MDYLTPNGIGPARSRRTRRHHQDYAPGFGPAGAGGDAIHIDLRHHPKELTERVLGRVLDKGLSGDELGERVRLVVDALTGGYTTSKWTPRAGRRWGEA